MGAWVTLLAVALLCGLPLNHVTIFWVGVVSVWAISKGGSQQ
jgi:hypothetical protein